MCLFERVGDAAARGPTCRAEMSKSDRETERPTAVRYCLLSGSSGACLVVRCGLKLGKETEKRKRKMENGKWKTEFLMLEQ